MRANFVWVFLFLLLLLLLLFEMVSVKTLLILLILKYFSSKRISVLCKVSKYDKIIITHTHYLKKYLIRSYSIQHFPAFRLNTERNSASLRSHSECGKMQTRITPNTDSFHAVTDKKYNKMSKKNYFLYFVESNYYSFFTVKPFLDICLSKTIAYLIMANTTVIYGLA